MGYYMQQKMEPSFLVKLDMEVKGDPWYLGKADDGSSTNHSAQGLDTDESNEDYVVFDKKDNVISTLLLSNNLVNILASS